MRRFFFLLALPLAAQPELPVAWVRTSVEYAALSEQAYRGAAQALEAALAQPQWTAALEQKPGFAGLPPAVILDLDETVLDNSEHQAALAAQRIAFDNEKWNAWVAQAKATAVPGAIEFLKFAQMRGVALVYVTNRTCKADDENDPTVRNLRRLGAPLSPARLLCRTGSGSDKSARRAAVAESYRVLLLVGDDFQDFVSVPAEQNSIAGRREILAPHRQFFGQRWFLLPNPMYGSWERVLQR
jgi:acid phosphatase